MRVEWSDLAGVSLEAAVRHQDDRGSFDKLYTGGPLLATQLCSSFNHLRGTVRGLHFQVEPDLERKALWCTAGELFDVLVDTRVSEPTYGAWASVHLSASAAQLLRLPPGVAHGYQTLVDETAVAYLIDGPFAPKSARTIRWDDPTLKIDWPRPPSAISAADRNGRLWPAS
ncbi:MAG: dTDP-4-dehydrorhamnose 3,5-epimerase family protein [Marmoricola sp.]